MSRGKITDTELQVGQFVVPPFGHSIVDESEAARYSRKFKEDLPVDHVSTTVSLLYGRADIPGQWFPMEYYGNERNGGKNGHYYHVFNTPLYYGIPAGANL